MKVTGIDGTPIGRVPFLNVDRNRQVVRESLPILMGTVSGLPTGTAGLVAMADLQGRERGRSGPGRLLGLLVAGDFFAVPELDRRGGLGDVSEVWRAFGRRFRWVAGVLGNHDVLDSDAQAPEPLPANTQLLDGRVAELDGLRIGGRRFLFLNAAHRIREGSSDSCSFAGGLLESALRIHRCFGEQKPSRFQNRYVHQRNPRHHP